MRNFFDEIGERRLLFEIDEVEDDDGGFDVVFSVIDSVRSGNDEC